MATLQFLGRSVESDAESAKTTFTTWDGCMAKSYCKYPVIIAIVIGSLIVLSVIFCLARCLCCGLECCCGCFSCFNRCCPSGRRSRRSRNADPPSGFAPNPYQGYQPTPNAPPAYEPPRFAQFDAPTKNGKPNEDALPAMPSWDNAASKKVENPDAQGDVEMGNLNRHSGQTLGIATGPGGRGRYSQIGANPPSPYGQQNTGYGSPDSTHPYGDIGAQRARPDYNYGFNRPSPSTQSSYQSPQHSPYNAPQNTAYRSPTSNTVPQGGFVSPPSADQFLPAAIAPSPNQHNAGQIPQASNRGSPSLYTSSSTRYEPSTQYDQGQGAGYSSPTNAYDNRPPSLLQAGRKPVAGSWRDI